MRNSPNSVPSSIQRVRRIFISFFFFSWAPIVRLFGEMYHYLKQNFFFNFRHIKNSTEIKNKKKIKTNKQTNKKHKQETYGIRLKMFCTSLWFEYTWQLNFIMWKFYFTLWLIINQDFFLFFLFLFFWKMLYFCYKFLKYDNDLHSSYNETFKINFLNSNSTSNLWIEFYRF